MEKAFVPFFNCMTDREFFLGNVLKLGLWMAP